MEKILPKIDISENFIVGSSFDLNENILNLYSQYPCRLQAEVFVLCIEGTIDAMINLSNYTIKSNDFITLSPGSIFQINKIRGNLRFYFMVFSSHFIKSIKITKPIIDLIYITKNNPVLSLPKEFVSIYQDFFILLIRTSTLSNSSQNPEIVRCILLSILYRLSDLYHDQSFWDTPASCRNEEICKIFGHLVIQHYTNERNIAFYAKKIGITPTHLSNTVKQTTGKTVMDIISQIVITDAKAQLKSTRTPINEIAESLNFANVSFFGKYFKRYVGVGPQKYRNG